MHVTTRAARRLPSLRKQIVLAEVECHQGHQDRPDKRGPCRASHTNGAERKALAADHHPDDRGGKDAVEELKNDLRMQGRNLTEEPIGHDEHGRTDERSGDGHTRPRTHRRRDAHASRRCPGHERVAGPSHFPRSRVRPATKLDEMTRRRSAYQGPHDA